MRTGPGHSRGPPRAARLRPALAGLLPTSFSLRCHTCQDLSAASGCPLGACPPVDGECPNMICGGAACFNAPRRQSAHLGPKVPAFRGRSAGMRCGGLGRTGRGVLSGWITASPLAVRGRSSWRRCSRWASRTWTFPGGAGTWAG